MPRTTTRSGLGSLTPREREALRLYADGHPVKVVADRMGDISPRTVEYFLAECRHKLGVRSIQQVLVAAAKAGVV